MRMIFLVAFAASCGLAAGAFAVAVLAISGIAYPGVFAGEPMVLASVGTVAARFLGGEVLAA